MTDDENRALAERLKALKHWIEHEGKYAVQQRDEWMQKYEVARAYADTLIEANNRLKTQVFRLENELADALEEPW